MSLRKMDFTCSTNSYGELLILLLMLSSSLSMECPPKCHCSMTRVLCINAGLEEVPKGIPLSVTEINLSDNPQIHIDRDYFLIFPKLNALFLQNVSQSGPLYLPNSLRTFVFSYNLITVNSLDKMFKNKLHFLNILDLQRNNINLTEIFPILPKGIQFLKLSGNSLVSLKGDDLNCCRNLKEFHCEYCSIKSIEPNAFKNAMSLNKIILSNNGIADLPKRLFEKMTNLLTLDLRNNHLKYFNASELHLGFLVTLELGYNRISSLDLQESTLITIGLENNMIRRLSANMLGRSHVIHEISMQNNIISDISQTAFKRVKFISALELQGNNIEGLPRQLFNNTYVSMLFLHKNRISNIDSLIRGMKKPPNLLTVFSNKDLKYLNTSSFERMDKMSRLFLTCSTLKSINMSTTTKASIKCSPNAELYFTIPFSFYRNKGYDCKWNHKHMHYRCHACPVGFYSDSNHKHCTQCPPGSFYQDEVASITCKSCPLGQYVPPSRSPGKDASDCQTCPQGTDIEKSAGTRACNCLKGFHRHYRFGPCHKCTHNGFSCVRDYPQLKRGFWMTWNGTGLTNRTCKHDFQEFILNLDTYNNDYDRKTMYLNCQLPIPIKCPRSDSCSGGIDSNCTSGYEGVLCGVCSKGYSRVFNRCVKCPHLYIVILEFIGCFVLFVILCIIVNDKTDTTNINECRLTSNDTEIRSFRDKTISILKILINFYQTLVGIVYAYSFISWPANFQKVYSVLEYIQIEVIRLPSLRCIHPELRMDSIQEFWFMLISSLTFPALCLLYFIVKVCYLHFSEPSRITSQQRRNICARGCIKVASLFLYLTYPLVSTRIIHILPVSCNSVCTAMHNGMCLHSVSFLRSDYSLACPSMHTHKYTLIIAYCALIIPLGLPFVLWITLKHSFPTYQHQQTSIRNPQHISSSETTSRHITDNDPYSNEDADLYLVDCPVFEDPSVSKPSVFIHALKFTYENYKEKYWYWETVEMIRKLIMTTGAALFFYHTKIGLSSLIIVAMGFAILHATHKPMKDGFENLLQMISLMVIALNLSVGALIQSDIGDSNQSNQSDLESWKLGIFLIIINSLIIVLICTGFGKMLIHKIMDRAFCR